jgi:hypothetical protein
MTRLGFLVVACAALGCGSDGNDNELGRATVDGEVMGASISSGAIAWRATLAGTGNSLIAIHETGVACNANVNTGSTLIFQFGCALESGSFTVVADGGGSCPDQILALLENDGEDLAFATGGTLSLDMGETSLSGSFDVDFGEENLSGSFNLRDCGEVSLPD